MSGFNLRIALWLLLSLLPSGRSVCLAQVDPYPRSLLEFGYDQSVFDQGPQTLYAYYHYNNPALGSTNMALRLVAAPVYFDGELGLRNVLPHTDLGLGLNGGGFGENYYELRQGRYLKEESFDGHGGGASLSIYHLINPGQLIPLNLIAQGGVHYSTYSATDRTDDRFRLPRDRVSTFTRLGVRLAGKEPMLYEALGMEVSVWYEHQWRLDDTAYGFAGDRNVEPSTALYWLYAGMSYAWTNSGQQVAFALTAGGTENADRFSAWRLGGVLPLSAEYPITLPGYYYQELSAQSFVHFSAEYVIPLSHDHRWKLRLSAASAYVEYLPGLEEGNHWQTGTGPSLSFSSRSGVWQTILRYGYGVDAIRDGHTGAHSVGLLYQYNFEARKQRRAAAK